MQKGKGAVEWTLKNILITCEDVFKTHMFSFHSITVISSCCIESFLNSVIEGNLSYQENINPGYNTLAIYASLQTAIQSFVDKFIVVPTASSSAVALKMGNRGNRGNMIAFSYADSSSWISSQQDVLTSM